VEEHRLSPRKRYNASILGGNIAHTKKPGYRGVGKRECKILCSVSVRPAGKETGNEYPIKEPVS
jgi:hypothetical protein